jgi:hypothetical protein
MTIVFFDRQEESNPLNNTTIDQASDLVEVLNGSQTRDPFFCELVGENGFNLLLGVGRTCTCAQYNRADGSAPYLMAVVPGEARDGYTEFLMGDTLTPVPMRYCIPFDGAKRVAVHFLQTGDQSPLVSWEEI